ncbi:MAG TPA: hypothetical protein VFP84_23125 [Kofleriaceae bacterium]|nr:hypothetical protein [Kofleriaceae bacterium]
MPLDVYVWKDAATGQFHLYDLTTPSRPHEQVVDGLPTAAHWKTFFEEVARYPEGEVRFRVPGGGGDVAPTTGKTRWYEWVGYAGLAIAAVGLAALTAGASVPATVCFATGAVAGGLSAAGHLADTAYLGTATTATVVLDVAQLVASFASFGAMSVTIKAGRAAAALATSRWFVPLVTTAATADAVQLVALTEVTIVELDKLQRGAGSTEDKQRAMAVLVTQLIVTGGLTALSVRGAANARALAGQALEVVEQNGINILRIADAPAEPTASSSAAMGEHERWLARLEASLDPAEQAKLAKMKTGKTPDQTREMLGHDLEAAHERVRAEVRAEQERAAIAAQSKARVAELRRQIAERDLMNDPEIRALLAKHAKNPSERLHRFRDKLLAKILHVEAERMYPGAEVLDSVEIYEQLREAEVEAWITDHPNQLREGLVRRDGQPYMQRGEIDMMVIERQPSGRAKIIAREEIKTGLRDSNASARGQLNAQSELLREAAAGHKVIRLELAGRDISAEIDVATDAMASKSTRGPARKGFDTSLGASAADLEALCKDLLARGAEAP